MPVSSFDGRGWIIDRIAASTARTIIDGGAGAGTYATAARHTRLDAHWVGVEVWRRYVKRFALQHLYDEVVVADLRNIDAYTPNGAGYLLILGDVIEHMRRTDALALLAAHMAPGMADEIIVSTPIVHSAQRAWEGNKFEAHLDHWGFEEMRALLPGCDTFEGVEVGRFHWVRS